MRYERLQGHISVVSVVLQNDFITE